MDEPKSRPTMFILAGPNGAGKTTLYEQVLQPKIAAPFINADLIQKNELIDQSMNGAYEAAKIAELRRREYIKNKQSFVSESTFSHPSKLQLIKDARLAGFRVVTFHVNLRTADLSVARVQSRVTEGGHDVPEEKIRARYQRNKELIKEAVTISNKAVVFENSSLNKSPERIIAFTSGYIDRIADDIPEWAESLYHKELATYRRHHEKQTSTLDNRKTATKTHPFKESSDLLDKREDNAKHNQDNDTKSGNTEANMHSDKLKLLEEAYNTMPKKEALKKYPELDQLYKLEADTRQFAKNYIDHPTSREQFISTVRNRGLDELAKGNSLPTLKSEVIQPQQDKEKDLDR